MESRKLAYLCTRSGPPIYEKSIIGVYVYLQGMITHNWSTGKLFLRYGI
jgi:hypothetical protein